jgi:SAM-dependent methyltransferase
MSGYGPEIDVDAFNAFEAEGWEERALGYDRFFRSLTGRVADALLDAAAVGAGTRVLDAGTGPGTVARRAADRGAQVIGVDVAESMVALARRLDPELDIRKGDVHALPFEDGSFHAVVANFLLPHLGDPEGAGAELSRVLAPGGRLALTTWDSPARSPFLSVILEAVAEAGAVPPPDLPAGPELFRFADDDEADALLGMHGLEDRETSALALVLEVGTGDELWEGLLGGTVRISALVRGQSADVQERIRAGFDRRLELYRKADGFELPVSVKLLSGRKPG